MAPSGSTVRDWQGKLATGETGISFRILTSRLGKVVREADAPQAGIQKKRVASVDPVALYGLMEPVPGHLLACSDGRLASR